MLIMLSRLAPDTDGLKGQFIQPWQDQARSRIKQSKVLIGAKV